MLYDIPTDSAPTTVVSLAFARARRRVVFTFPRASPRGGMPSPAPPAPKSPKRANATIALARAPRACSGAALGYFFIALVCVIWIAASFLVARLEAHGLSPVLLSFICSSGFIILVPLRLGTIARGCAAMVESARGERAGQRDARRGAGRANADDEAERGHSSSARAGAAKKRTPGEGHANAVELVPLATAGGEGETRDAERGKANETAASRAKRRGEAGMYSFEYHLKAAFVVAPIWVMAQLAFDYSLLMTTVTANSMLSSSSAVFTFVVSVYMGLDKFSWMKVAAIVAYVIGTVLVTLADRDPRGVNFDEASAEDMANNALGQNIQSPALGNVLALAAAGLYALYTATMKLYLKDDDKTDMTLFFALMGIFNFVGYGAVLIVTRALNGLPNLFFAFTERVFWLACAKAFFDNVLSDYLWARAVLLTSPTVASIGLSLQIPLAATVEVFIGQPAWASHFQNAALMASGTLFVIAGFLGVA